MSPTQSVKTVLNFTLPLIAVAFFAGCSNHKTSTLATNESQGIVNGVAVDHLDPVAKSTVALYLKFPSGGKVVQFCTGTLIGKKTVLTAAHCLNSVSNGVGAPIENLLPFIKVGFGLPVTELYTDAKVQFADVSGVNVHQDFSMEKLAKLTSKTVLPDIALIQLAKEAPARFSPVKILRDESKLKQGSKVILAGYGLTQAIPMPIEASELRQVEVTVEDPRFDQTQFAYLAEEGKSSCSGDSGGPAYVQDPETKELYVAGVTSFGDRDCTLMGVYTSVPTMLGWIDKHYENLESGKAPILELPTPEEEPVKTEPPAESAQEPSKETSPAPETPVAPVEPVEQPAPVFS